MAALAKTSPVHTGPQLDNRRVAAALIDLLIPLAGLALTYAAGLSLTRGLVLVGVGWTLFYFFALESGDGQTLGKHVMKLRVVSADGTPASMEQIAKRTLVRIVDGHIVGLIVMLGTGERRLRLGDIVAGTVVTEAESAASAPEAELVDSRAARMTAAPASPPPGKAPFFKRELSLPSLRRSQKPLSATPKAKEPSVLKRELALPFLGRKGPRRTAGASSAAPGPGAAAAPGPGAAAAPSAFPDPLESIQNDRLTDALRASEPPEVEPYAAMFDSPDYDEPNIELGADDPVLELDGPEPTVELDGPQAWDEIDEPDPMVPFGGDEPVVELDEPEPEPEAGSLAELEPWAEEQVRAHTEHAVEPEAEPSSDEDADVTIKPIETVSAIDLVMQDADERRPADH